MMKDPAKVTCRIFVGNLPTDDMERKDLKDLFSKFGLVTGVLLNRGFGFVQFDNETSAAEAIKSNGTIMFNGKKVDIRPARRHGSDKKEVERDRSPNSDYFDRGRDVTRYPVDPNAPPVRSSVPFRSAYPPSALTDRANDCEIIVINKKQTEYAESIEVRLKKLGLTVDLLFPNEEVPVTRVLAKIASRGSLYAILIMPQNEDHRSLTLNILHGQPQEHRNMPLEDAINLLARNFDAYLLREKASRPSEVNVVPATGPLTAINLTDRHPEAIQVLLNLLADNRQLTVLQYDKVISYLQGRKELQLKVELVPSVSLSTVDGQKQQELQSRILNILNNKTANLIQPSPLVQQQQQQPTPTQTPILNDPNVQKVLDSLMQSDLLRKISGGPSRF
ncbi:conserved hypothetical protein [Pediculus humanus corporis]|uniref:RRM domain-containing protein n=1 Tax=Pediculus humanus subsp. corporis TaxID=121224 RepID=E0V9E4_PEDHC|nr:uncharacterized protein Phum_PHUM009800 [Pediculus humanus corporis]EEB10000.1 conserved hypothetical protein [Pediculus humanus corporis]